MDLHEDVKTLGRVQVVLPVALPTGDGTCLTPDQHSAGYRPFFFSDGFQSTKA